MNAPSRIPSVAAHSSRPSAQAWLATLLAASADAVIGCDPEGLVTGWNRAAASLYGYSAEEMIGQPILDVVPVGQLAASRSMLARLKRGGEVRGYEAVHRRKDGALVEVAVHAAPVNDETGATAGFALLVRDIGEIKRASVERARLEVELERSRAHLQHMQRMDALGSLAGGVAHDFNNLLCIVRSYADLVLDELAEDHPLREDVEAIRDAGRRAADLTRQLLAFGRRQVLVPKVVDPNDLVASMARMLRRVVGEPIDVVTRLTPDLGTILIDPGQLEQVVLNLGTNARDAMPKGGTLTIETSAVERGVRIAVTDSGCGMDETTSERMFEPFFTTKEKGKGTGLGLATVYGIVQQSGGHIEVRSAPGEGTTVAIDLPRHHARSARNGASVEPPPSSRRGGRETVLLVEDDDDVRRVAASILRKQGYRVVQAAGADEALRAFDEHGASIQLLLTDVVMPGMGGPQLAERLTARREGLPVLFMTGHSDDPVLHYGVRDGGVVLLHKPFTPESLASKVREVLDAPR